MQHLLALTDIEPQRLEWLIDKAIEVKKNPQEYARAFENQTLLMIFAKPSLRTRVSFETGMTQMGGHGIYYDIATSPMGKKETVADTAKTASRMVDIVMARLFEHSDIEDFAANSRVPVINALTNYTHPCQVVADLQTVKEHKGKLRGLKMAYVGDSFNNVTHSLLFGCTMVGMDIAVASPAGEQYAPMASVVEKAREIAAQTSCKVTITNDPIEAVKDADVLYTDSWMSYHIPEDQKAARFAIFEPYRITSELVSHAKPDYLFEHCLPAQRGVEMTADVIDGPNSVIFDEAENRLHAQKAIMLWLCGKIK